MAAGTLGTNPVTSKIPLTAGWWVFIGCTGCILLSATPVGPFLTGVIVLAFLYQLRAVVQHIPINPTSTTPTSSGGSKVLAA